MSRLAGFPTNNPHARRLQIRVKGKAVQIVDKETQQLIAGVTNWQVDMQPGRAIAKIEITITDQADIFVSDEVEGSIVDALPALPVRTLAESVHVYREASPEERRQALAELT